MDGLLVIDKPQGITSRDAVNRVQRLLPRGTKIGHTGTLDPLATGVLVFCMGSATKLADRIQAMGKSYETTIRLGATSTTDDAEGEFTATVIGGVPTLARIHELLPRFTGEIEQLPPQFSALKVSGRRAHDLARRGEDVPLKPRIVRVDHIELRSYVWPTLSLAIDCGKGTYIRSIARDVGIILGVGGFVEQLRRTRVGPFTVAMAPPFPEHRDAVVAALIDPAKIMESVPDSA